MAKHRDYAAINYLGHDARAVVAYLISSGRHPSWRYSTMVIAASSALSRGHDELAAEIANIALDSHPEMAEARLVLADLASYRGVHDAALHHAKDAWLISPNSAEAAIKTIRLSYLSSSPAQADAIALAALERFPNDEKILWAACKHCYSSNQFDRIMNWWNSGKRIAKETSSAARPLAAAALRARRITDALSIYVNACLAELQGQGVGSQVKEKRLAGKNGLSVLRDLCTVLESADIPFFFAAGTALGIVRNGRPLDHDNDIDVGIFEDDWNREKLVEIFMKHPNFDLDDSNPNSPKIGLVHRGGANIDLFKFYREGDHVFHDAIFVRWKNRPFDIERYEMASGDVVFIPSNVDGYLTENYGNWRIPDSQFDAFVDGPNVQTTWPEYLQVHRIRRAYKFIRALDMTSAHRELLAVKDILTTSASGCQLIKEMQL